MEYEVVKLAHSRVNFVWITDLHLSAIPPGRRGDDYAEVVFNKLKFVRELTDKLNGVCLVGGDVFHNKYPKSPGNSLGLIEESIHLFSSFPLGKVWGTIGNHDISNDRLETLPNQPLGILIAAGVYHNLVNNPVLFVNQDESVKVSVETFSYAGGEQTLKNILAAGPRHPEAKYRVGIVHAYGMPGNGGTIFGEPKIGYNQVKGADFDYLLWGHDHSRTETEEVGGITHIRFGSMARAAFSYDEKERPVSAAIISFAQDGIRYKEKPIPVQPLEVVFVHADKGVEKVGKSSTVLDFFSQMDDAVEGIETSEPREVLKTLAGDDPKLLQLVLELCNL